VGSDNQRQHIFGEKMSMIPQTIASHGDIVGLNLVYVDQEASVLDASKLMRQTGATELLVIDRSRGTLLSFGIVTANDIVTRVIAAGLDPAVLTTGDIAWSGMDGAGTGVSPVI